MLLLFSSPFRFYFVSLKPSSSVKHHNKGCWETYAWLFNFRGYILHKSVNVRSHFTSELDLSVYYQIVLFQLLYSDFSLEQSSSNKRLCGLALMNVSLILSLELISTYTEYACTFMFNRTCICHWIASVISLFSVPDSATLTIEIFAFFLLLIPVVSVGIAVYRHTNPFRDTRSVLFRCNRIFFYISLFSYILGGKCTFFFGAAV